MPYADKNHPNNVRIRTESRARVWRRDLVLSSIKQSFRAAKHRSSIKGHAFDLDIEYVLALPRVCAVSGLAFRREEGDCARMFSPSLDRIDPSLGYVRGNVRLMLHGLNALKGKETDELLIEVCKAVAEFNK